MNWNEIKKARHRLSKERGTITKDWGGRIPIALIYPNSYYTGMSNLGVHAIYRLLNSFGNIVCERAFWEKEDAVRKQSVISLESQRPLTDFAVLAFSISYELDYFNIVQVLKNSGIPLYAADRDERHPLVIAGGPCIIANPMPLVPFFDCLGIGEGETILPSMLPVLSEGIRGKRSELLKSLASLPGIYVPLLHPEKPIARQRTGRLDDHPATTSIITRDTELGDLYLIEVERGCPWSCRFCLVSRAFRPARFYSAETILAQAETGLKYRNRLGLVGPTVTDHPQIEEIVVKLRQRGAGLSMSSSRVSPISRAVLDGLITGKARTITLAPEAGSERLRQVIRKDITEDAILEAMDKVSQAGLQKLKLYFMIGLPTETEEDIEEIVNLTLNCQNIINRQHSGGSISLNIAPFVPKAGTSFQWLPMAPVPILNQRISLLKKELAPQGIKLKAESPAWSEVQGILARGDARLAPVLANVETVSLAGWRRSVANYCLDTDYYAHQRWDISQTLPWEILISDTERQYLEMELKKALSEADTTCPLNL